jgi:hypothetical protein
MSKLLKEKLIIAEEILNAGFNMMYSSYEV